MGKKINRSRLIKATIAVFFTLCIITALALIINRYGVPFKWNRLNKPIAAKSIGLNNKSNNTKNSIKASDIRELEKEKKFIDRRKNNTNINASRNANGNTNSNNPSNTNGNNSACESNPKSEDHSRGIPVLMYHSIEYEKGNDLRVPKEKFAEQMKYLKDNGYTTLTLDEVYSYLVNNKQIPPKTVAITFDDGYEDNYTNAFPIMKQYGVKGTVFVITKTVDKNNSYLTSKQIKEMDQNGMMIESHTVSHDALTSFNYDKQYKELADSKAFLEKCLGRKIKYLAYPCGSFNNNTVNALKESGYLMAFTTVNGNAKSSQEIYALKRVRISADYSLETFKYYVR